VHTSLYYNILGVDKLFNLYLLILIRGHSLIGKTAILHIAISGSSPDISNLYIISKFIINKWLSTIKKNIAREAQLVERNSEDV
jgi:hypothetical protein